MSLKFVVPTFSAYFNTTHDLALICGFDAGIYSEICILLVFSVRTSLKMVYLTECYGLQIWCIDILQQNLLLLKWHETLGMRLLVPLLVPSPVYW